MRNKARLGYITQDEFCKIFKIIDSFLILSTEAELLNLMYVNRGR